MEQQFKLILILFLPLPISIFYLIGTQQGRNWYALYPARETGKQSEWYWVGGIIRSLFGFAINVVWPYVISEWTSIKYGILLTLYCFFMDTMFRLCWYFTLPYLNQHQPSKDIFLVFWAATNDINTFFIVPSAIYYRFQRKQHQISKQDESDEYMDISMQKLPKKTTLNTSEYGSESLVFEQLLAETNYHNEYSRNKHFIKMSIIYIIFGIWFTVQDCYQFVNSNVQYSALIRLPPFLCATVMFVWELYVCKTHKRMRFVHYSLMCLVIPVQQLYFDWTYLVVQLREWSSLMTLDHDVARLIIFVVYTTYFQVITFIGFKLSEHISIKIEYVFELNFIFIYYADMFLTIYLSLTTDIDWNIFIMIIIKSTIKMMTFDHWIIDHVPFQIVNTKKLAKRYLYSVLSTLSVFVGQNVLLIVDYLQYSYNDDWMLSAPKTLSNLLISMLVFFMTFIGQCIAYFMIWYRSKYSSNPDYQDNYSWAQLKKVPVNVPYFCIVVAMSQIYPLMLTRFFPLKN